LVRVKYSAWLFCNNKKKATQQKKRKKRKKMEERISRWMNPWPESTIAAAEVALDSEQHNQTLELWNTVVHRRYPYEIAIVDKVRGNFLDVRVKGFLGSGEFAWMHQIWLSKEVVGVVPAQMFSAE
tara:strand:- start:816 stop:1193 length:378 start_codon:yes stop_codon:yes gene_type:complete